MSIFNYLKFYNLKFLDNKIDPYALELTKLFNSISQTLDFKNGVFLFIGMEWKTVLECMYKHRIELSDGV